MKSINRVKRPRRMREYAKHINPNITNDIFSILLFNSLVVYFSVKTKMFKNKIILSSLKSDMPISPCMPKSSFKSANELRLTINKKYFLFTYLLADMNVVNKITTI